MSGTESPVIAEPAARALAAAARKRPLAPVAGATPPGLELRHLRYLVAVADAGTFTQAAEQMFMAQPTLSQQIRRLEELVGTALLHRRREGVRLTPAGRVLLEESRAILSLVEHSVRMTRQAAGLGRPLLRVAIPPGMPESLAAVIATRLLRLAADAGVEVAWLETPLDGKFSLIQQHRADAALGWVTGGQHMLPERLDRMMLGEFEPQAWIPAAHPAARRQQIGLGQLAALKVAHGPRRASTATYDSWRAILRSADPQFEFTDPPFQQPLLMTLAFAATASRPAAVLTGPRSAAGAGRARRDELPASAYGMVPVRLQDSPLTASASLVWHADLPRPLQQIISGTAAGVSR